MGKRIWTLLLIGLFILLVVPVQAAELSLPPRPQRDIYIQDYANVIGLEAEQAILELGARLDTQTGAQVVVVTTPNLADRPIEDYALRLFRAWGIGQREKNNGVLMLIAPTERTSRIEVGYGLEGALPDALTGRIQDEFMIPYFREGNYDQGVWQGYQAIAGRVAQEYNVELGTPDLVGQTQQVPVKRVNIPWWSPFLFLGFLVLDFLLFRGFITRTLVELLFWSFLFRGGGRGGGGGLGGGGFGGGSSGGGGSSRNW